MVYCSDVAVVEILESYQNVLILRAFYESALLVSAPELDFLSVQKATKIYVEEFHL